MTDQEYLNREERMAARLASLYRRRGFRQYKMGSFEEYSLYLDNQDFLVSKQVITFGGLDGKLLSLRPDVTLSIVKNTKAASDNTEKLFYNEKVYRVSPEGNEFREISQAGVEVLGAVDGVTQAEMVELALETLETAGRDYLLDLSHMGFVAGLIDSLGVTEDKRETLYGLLRSKNTHDVRRLAAEWGLAEEQVADFEKLVGLGGEPDKALAEARALCHGEGMAAAVDELEALVKTLRALGKADRIHLNFSIANNAGYYNGIIFNGYLEGVPHSVLTGGRYDKLLEKFGKPLQAIGFAFYLGELERYFAEVPEATDVRLLYGAESGAGALLAARKLAAEGLSVRLANAVPAEGRFRRTMRLFKGALEEVEQ